MRFDSKSTSNKSGLSGRERLRLWALIGCLGIVLVAMKQLRQPETVQRLDRLFGIQAEPASTDSPVKSEADANQQMEPIILGNRSEIRELPQQVADSSEIKDNTYFRPQESSAWFDAFARLQETTAEQLASRTLGEITYVQFIQQPDVYRHRVVTVRGTIVREEEQRPVSNPLGIEIYHRLWLAPHGGGRKPVVVYCRNLPDEFPRGEDLRQSATVTGEFFKNWSYRYEGGLGIAPVVLAQEIDWQPPAPKAPEANLPLNQLIWAATGVGVLALVVVWMAIRNTTRRPRTTMEMPSTFVPPATDDESPEGSKP